MQELRVAELSAFASTEWGVGTKPKCSFAAHPGKTKGKPEGDNG